MGEKAIIVRNLTKKYEGLTALKSLNLQIDRGKIFGLLGPNGAGKTTALECILGTRNPDKGVIEILGEDPRNNRRIIFNKVGVQFQASSYPDRIRVEEMCELISSLYRKKMEWETLLTQFQLIDKKKVLVESLSGGEQQKLSLVLALIHRPEVVFLDELTTGLDPLARREVWRYLEKLKNQGLTIFLTSHYMDEVTYLCDRIAILHRGETVIEGSPSEIVENSAYSNLEEAYIACIEEREGKIENTVRAV
ncbi:MAG: ABC transporter ATP-binding protein [Spirochaetales bacterium]|nr:ABC transporter ATP-binding protein [Spirochaetales bacterium]